MPLRFRNIAWVAQVVAGVAFLCTPVVAQQQVDPSATPGEADARDLRQGVYVRDSAVAAEKLALAMRMQRLKEWDKSADVYQEIVEKYADRVVPVSGGGAGAQRYTSVTLAVQELLGKWPDEGLNEYRARYETPAATMLESAGSDDVAALSRVVQTYFATDSARTAGIRLVELYIESGEFGAAAWTGERLLAHHPGINIERPSLLFRTALAQHLAGSAADVRSKLEELKNRHADATGTFRGQDVNLAQTLEKLLDSPAAIAHAGSAGNWPMMGGDVTRGRVPDVAGRPHAKLVDIPLVRARPRPAPNAQVRAQADADTRNRREAGLSLAIFPVIDRGELFYEDGGRVYARGLESGLPLPGWTSTYPEDTRPRYAPRLPAGIAIRRNMTQGGLGLQAAPSTVTVTDHSVLAVLARTDAAPAARAEWMMAQGMARDTQLVCLDRANGARRWSVSPAQFPESQAKLRDLTLGGSPLVVGDNVYLAARGGKPMQFEDSYVLCFNLADGKLKWACYLASGNATDANMGGQMPVSPVISHLAFSGGRIYAVSNLGAVAAVDGYAGTIVWLSIYPRPEMAANRMGGFAPGNFASVYASIPKPWAYNPAIVKDGKVFALPSDSQHVLVYDAAAGTEIARIPTAEFESADTLLAVIDDKLILSGKNKVFCVNWPAFRAGAKVGEKLHWYGLASVQGSEGQNEDAIRGRGFVTADSVFIPTTAGLRRISIENGSVLEYYPKGGKWPTGEGPGNLLVTADQVIIAGADSIGIYSELALARAKMDRAVEAAPNDALPRLKYAEMLFAAGYLQPAVEKLDEAIKLLGGLRAMRQGTERDRVFARALTFAERAADPKAGASDPTETAALYDRAAAAASSASQQVAYRFSRARFARQQRDFMTEVQLLQEVLSDASYRGVTVPTEDGSGTTRASDLAEAGIARRQRDYPTAYAPFEEAAGAALADAQRSGDTKRLMAVAETYPNAKAAPAALLAAADLFEAAGQHRAATQVLNQVYFEHRDSADTARIFEAQARNYLKLPNGIDVAIARLKGAASRTGGSPILKGSIQRPDGEIIQGVTFAAAADLLQTYSATLATERLPDFRVPRSGPDLPAPFLPEDPQSMISNVDQLLMPPREMRDFVRHDRVATWTGGKGVSVFTVGSGQPLGTCDAVKIVPRGCAWIGDDSGKGKAGDLLVWTADELFLLNGVDVSLRWSAPLRVLPTIEVEQSDREEFAAEEVAGPGVPVAPGMIVIDNQVINIRGGIRGVRPAGVPGRPAPLEGAAEQVEYVRPVGDRIVLGTSAGRIAAVNLADGRLAWQARAGQSPFDQVVANDDFVAARFSDDYGSQIISLKSSDGEIAWRRSFSAESSLAPLNLAIAPDGTLLYTLQDRVCGKNLYEPGDDLRFGHEPLEQNGNRMFEASFGPDQLLVTEGRILAIADRGQFVRQISLETGKEEPGTHQLATQAAANAWSSVWLRAVGPRVYVFNSRTMLSYNLNRPDEFVDGWGAADGETLRNAFIGRDHALLLDQPLPAGVDRAIAVPVLPAAEAIPAGPAFRIRAYARYLTESGSESGKLDHNVQITHPVGIDQWCPVEGGIYYRSVDRKAHFLRGSQGSQAR